MGEEITCIYNNDEQLQKRKFFMGTAIEANRLLECSATERLNRC